MRACVGHRPREVGLIGDYRFCRREIRDALELANLLHEKEVFLIFFSGELPQTPLLGIGLTTFALLPPALHVMSLSKVIWFINPWHACTLSATCNKVTKKVIVIASGLHWLHFVKVLSSIVMTS